MTFGTFALISLIYCVIGVRVLYQVVRAWPSLWDRTFTPNDRLLISQAAFFLLVPISVALHELGHAVAIWSFGGRVTDFGFYVFAGFVAYREPFDALQQTVVAAAGTAVNIVLCAGALWAALLRRPPLRAPVNELLVQFAAISGVNALVIYPLLDFSSGLNGDFRQMYSFDDPVASTVVLVIHLAAIAFGLWAFRSRTFRALVDRRTDRPVRTGGNATGRQVRPVDLSFAQPPSPFPEQSLLGRTATRFREAGERLTAGWPVPLQHGVVPITTRAGAPPSGVALLLRWQSPSDQRRRQIIAQSLDGVGLRVIGQAGEQEAPDGESSRTSYLVDEPAMASDDELVVRLRLAMEKVEQWRAVTSG